MSQQSANQSASSPSAPPLLPVHAAADMYEHSYQVYMPSIALQTPCSSRWHSLASPAESFAWMQCCLEFLPFHAGVVGDAIRTQYLFFCRPTAIAARPPKSSTGSSTGSAPWAALPNAAETACHTALVSCSLPLTCSFLVQATPNSPARFPPHSPVISIVKAAVLPTAGPKASSHRVVKSRHVPQTTQLCPQARFSSHQASAILCRHCCHLNQKKCCPKLPPYPPAIVPQIIAQP